MILEIRNMMRRLRLIFLGLVLREIPFTDVRGFFKGDLNKISSDYKKNCYMTWKSSRLPRSHARDLRKFIESNSEFSFYFFDDADQEKWMESNFPNTRILQIYRDLNFPAAKSDVFRYAIVWKLGGTFFSINRLTHMPLSELIGSLKSFQLSFSKVPYERDTEFPSYPVQYKGLAVIQYTVSAEPKNDVLNHALQMIQERSDSYQNINFEKVNRAIWNLTGPYLLTDAVDRYLNRGSVELEIKGFEFLDSLWIPKGLKYRYLQSPSYMSYRNKKVLGT